MKYIFISFAWDDFDDPWLTRQYIMSELAKHEKVLYTTLPMRVDKLVSTIKSGKNISSIIPSINNITSSLKRVKTAGLFPKFYEKRERLNLLSDNLRAKYFDTILSLNKWKGNRILYIWNPDFHKSFDTMKHDLSIFHCDDYFPDFYENDSAENRAMERNLEICLRKADIVFTTCTELEKKLSTIYKREYTRFVHGVVYSDYRAAKNMECPKALEEIPGPRLAHIGRINNKINTQLLAKIAEQKPEWSIILKGPITADLNEHTQKGLRELEKLKNGYFLPGEKPQGLPRYYNSIDIGLMAYNMDRWSPYILPMKYYEYLAAGKPMICSPIPSMFEKSGFVVCVDTVSEWINSIQKELETDSVEKKEHRLTEASKYSWDNRAKNILEIVDNTLMNKNSC